MWTASVDSNLGEILLVLIPNGGIAGKGLLAFQAPLDLYCLQQVDNEQKPWFAQLDTNLQGTLCELAQPFLNSIYSGDWNYSEDEYEFFQARSKAFPISEDLFKDGLIRAKNAWTDISVLLRNLTAIVNGLKTSQLKETAWFDPTGTILEFESLINTISLLASRHADEVRLKIE